jgi:hypothetical protein
MPAESHQTKSELVKMKTNQFLRTNIITISCPAVRQPDQWMTGDEHRQIIDDRGFSEERATEMAALEHSRKFELRENQMLMFYGTFV